MVAWKDTVWIGELWYPSHQSSFVHNKALKNVSPSDAQFREGNSSPTKILSTSSLDYFSLVYLSIGTINNQRQNFSEYF